MIGLRRNKRRFYLCKKNPNDTTFGEPITVFLNYEPTNSIGERLTIGEDYSMYLRIKCTPKESSLFKDGDKCYVFVTPPKIHDKMCRTADYIVDNGPQVTINQGEINLRKLSGE